MPKAPEPLEALPHAESVDEVLDSIDTIIAWSIANSSRVGYFAALYKRITLAVRKAIADKEFQDCARMHRFDVAFANRYFDALNGHFHPLEFGRPTKAWELSLQEASNGQPVIVQHLLGACNAHIALDLGIIAHEMAAGDLPGLRDDFNKINDVLAGQTSDVVNSIDKVSRVLADVHAILQNYEIDFIEGSMDVLRGNAWEFAEELTGESDDTDIIRKRDLLMAQLGELIYRPGIPMAAIFDAIADEEQRDIAKNIRVLDEIASAPFRSANGASLCGVLRFAYREFRGLATATLESALGNSGRQASQDYVRYSPAMEQPGPNEEQIIQKLVDVLHRNSEWTFNKFKHGLRDAHAKSHAVLEGELVVDPDLPEHLRQGLFATPATYPVIARISSTQPTLHSDQIRGVRAIAIKVLGVQGPRAQEGDDATTQDFVMVDSPEFPFANARDYLWVGMPLAYVLTRTPDLAMRLVTEVLAAVVGASEAVSPLPSRLVPIPYFGKVVKVVKLFTTPNYYVLGLTFNTASALRYGDYVAKISVRPLSESVTRLAGERIPGGSGDDAHRILIADFFRDNDAEYEVCAQLCTNAAAIEDATMEWSTSPPPQRIAKLVFPQQDSDDYCRRVYADDLLSFNSWRALATHRPLGSINRLKAKVYEASSKFRHEMNGAPQVEPSGIGELPSCPV